MIVIIVSSDIEWQVLRALLPEPSIARTPYGESFSTIIAKQKVLFFQGGWGKVSAAASAQYAIGRFNPSLLINIGTCGGFGRLVKQGDILLAKRTIIYDIYELMGDGDEAVRAYTTDTTIAWAEKISADVRPAVLISADRDVVQQDVAELSQKYDAVAADWESGAIAWAARQNNIPVLILRGVSDIVTHQEAAAYNNLDHFEDGTKIVMRKLLDLLPKYIRHG